MSRGLRCLRMLAGLVVLALATACGGDRDGAAPAAIAGTWEERTEDNAQFLRESVKDERDVAKRDAWFARVDRLSRTPRSAGLSRFESDGRATHTTESGKSYEGSWTYSRGSVEMRLPPNINGRDHAERLHYRWNGTHLWYTRSVPVEGGEDDLMPVLLFRVVKAPDK